MFVLKSTHHAELESLRALLALARSDIDALQADHARLLHHLGLRKIDTPATPAGVKLVAADSPEAKAADARDAALLEVSIRQGRIYHPMPNSTSAWPEAYWTGMP